MINKAKTQFNAIRSKLQQGFKTKLPLVFVHSDTDLSRIKTKTNFILSPSFYWCKKETLAIKSTYKAKKLAQSIFFSNLPSGDFSYKVFKQDESFLFFAYDANKIYQSLLNQGLKDEFLGRIYFAQSLIKTSIPVKISENFVLMDKAGIIFVAPIALAKQTTTLSALGIEASSDYIHLRRRIALRMPKVSKVRAQNSSVVLVAALLGFWIISNITLAFLDLASISRYEEKTQKLFAQYKLPKTSFELDALRKKYEKIASKQEAIRKLVTRISSYYTTNDKHFVRISFSKNKLQAHFVDDGASKATLSKAFHDAKITQKEQGFVLEFEL